MMSAYIRCNESTAALALYHSTICEKDSICHCLAIQAAANVNIHCMQQIFECIPSKERNAKMVNLMMDLYANRDEYEQILSLYDISIGDGYTAMIAISACIQLKDYTKGSIICDEARTRDLRDIQLQTLMILFYGKYADRLNDAVAVFDKIPNEEMNIVVINAMMEVYIDCSLEIECIHLFQKIKNINSCIEPDDFSHILVLRACANSTRYHIGEQVAETLSMRGSSIQLQVALISFFGKCGKIKQCERLFDDLREAALRQSVGIWNALISAYGKNGHLDEAKKVYDRMMNEYEIQPDRHTFIHLISASNFVGGVEEAEGIWNGIEDEKIKYDEVVVNALIDCMARKGDLVKAKQFLIDHKLSENEHIFMSLMSGSAKHNDSQMSEKIFDEYSRVNTK